MQKKIGIEHKKYRHTLYKAISKYTMIAIANKIVENKKIKARFKILIEENSKNYKLVRSYKKVMAEAKVDWIKLEMALKQQKGKRLNKDLYSSFNSAIKLLNSKANYNPYNYNLISEKYLESYIDRVLKWCKKKFNRYSQVKKRRDDYNAKNYEKNKEEIKAKYEKNKGAVKNRTEINQEFNLKRHQNSKMLVLQYALKLLANNGNLTIKTLKNELVENNEKLGNTQISIYLRELKNEGLIDE